ncbi:lipocalin family protein [Neisseria sp. Dent CA1/247]|uniref:lipocalin family protein n=1 Tax=Neisseria sp. Dent CA1/247 TaxID=2912675 RepID=UPI001FD01E37|nr:lipocalin family protein [Neisseria sp. Dent CA1/247]UOO78139.1 lipocalin family protein [Neisseria sp. Dent CA1/247]
MLKLLTEGECVMKMKGLFLLGAVCCAASAQAEGLPPLQTVPQVDVQRYAGQWYEIARLPMPYQNQCASDVTAFYQIKSKDTISVTNRCLKADGTWSVAEGLARVQNAENTKLNVTFLPKAIRWLPVGKAPYWVMALDSDYQYAMVGQPDRKYLWLLSRKPNMDEAVYQAYLQQAQAQGYDLSTLIRTKHGQAK